jgi:hypothetical protein
MRPTPRLRRAVAIAIVAVALLTGCEPNSGRQYNDVKLLGNAFGTGIHIESFEWYRGASSLRNRYWYLDWASDGCSTPVGNGDWVRLGNYPFHYKHVPFWKGCHRHDFNWHNLYGIEKWARPRLDTWTVYNRNRADDRFLNDLVNNCNDTLGGSYTIYRFECWLWATSYYVAVNLVPHSNIGSNYTHNNGL